MKIGIIYGTSMGNTQDVAEQIKEHLGDAADDPIEVIRFDPPDIAQYDVLLLGIPTWHVGEMQDDWEDVAEQYNIPQMNAKKVGFFGCGDQAGYPTTFGDAFGHLWDIIEPAGPELIGRCSTDGYEFEESFGVRDGTFLGLMCDNDYQPELTDDRIAAWCKQLKQELGLETVDA
ncbi:MAG: flavodoxin [Planctomycetota bacterium]